MTKEEREKYALDPSIEKILEGLDEFSTVVKKRVRSGYWKQDDLDLLNSLRNRFNDLEMELSWLKTKTW